MDIQNKQKEYKKTYDMTYSCQYHVIFCPKYRRSVLKDGVDKRLKEIILDLKVKYDFDVIEMEVMSNHVHLLLNVNPKFGIYNVISKIKGQSSSILRKEFPFLKSKLPCLWTRSKFISTVGSVSLEVVKKYIEEQKNV